MKRSVASLVVLVCLCPVLLGCGMKADIAKAGTSVTHFHAQLDSQDYTGIYNEAHPRFRTATTVDDFRALLTAVHSKLGSVQSSTQQRFFVNYNTSGSTVTVTYATDFAGGKASEEFVWAKSGDTLQLLGYHINSNALITK
jgi:hypothetical protein